MRCVALTCVVEQMCPNTYPPFLSITRAGERGGALYLSSAIGLILRRCVLEDNFAGLDGGAFYALKCAESTETEPSLDIDGTPVSDLYGGLRVFETKISRNAAGRSGGGIGGTQSSLYAQRARFIDNVVCDQFLPDDCIGGSAIAISEDLVLERCHVATIHEMRVDGSLLEGRRIALDNSSLSVNRGVAIHIGVDLTGKEGNVRARVR